MVENLGRHAVLLGDKLLRNFSDGVDRKGEPVVLLGVGMETNLRQSLETAKRKSVWCNCQTVSRTSRPAWRLLRNKF